MEIKRILMPIIKVYIFLEENIYRYISISSRSLGFSTHMGLAPPIVVQVESSLSLSGLLGLDNKRLGSPTAELE